MEISKKIIELKHWKLFFLIVLPLAWTSPSPLNEIINSIGIVSFGLWIYGIGIYGYEKIKEYEYGISDININRFKLNCKMTILTLALIFILINSFPESKSSFSIYDIILIPISLYLSYTAFYTIIFAAKTLTILELKRKVTFVDYLLNLFLIGNLVIGIWFIQPKVKKLILTETPNF